MFSPLAVVSEFSNLCTISFVQTPQPVSNFPSETLRYRFLDEKFSNLVIKYHDHKFRVHKVIVYDLCDLNRNTALEDSQLLSSRHSSYTVSGRTKKSSQRPIVAFTQSQVYLHEYKEAFLTTMNYAQQRSNCS